MENNKPPKRPRTPVIQEAKVPAAKEVKLTEGQMKVLDHIIPGFMGVQKEEEVKTLFEKMIPGFNDPTTFTAAFQSKIENMREDNRVVAAFGTIYSSVSSYRRDIITDVDKIRRFYLVDVILTQMSEDVLAPDSTTGDIIKVWSKNEAIQKELDLLNDEFDFDDLIADITPDVIAYGEYHLKPAIDLGKRDKEGRLIKGPDGKVPDANMPRGITDLHDTVDQTRVVAITKSGKIDNFLVENDKKQLALHEPADFIKFTLGNQKLRVDLWKEYGGETYKANNEVLKKIPRYIRMGKSLLYPIIGKIKELELLEAMVPAAKLSKLSSGTLVGVNLPAGVEIEKAMQASKKIEGMINRKVGIDNQRGEITIESIISSAGKLKVVPLMGEKGTLQKLDYQSDEPDNLLATLDDIRKAVLGTIGIPFEIIYGGGASKGEILKKYARYLRKLKNVQQALVDGVRQIIYIHLANKGVKYQENEINIEFRNKLIEIDNLDRLEFVDTTISLLKNLKEFFFELKKADSPIRDDIDMEEFKSILSEQLKTIGMSAVIKNVKNRDPMDKPTNPITNPFETPTADDGDNMAPTDVKVNPPAISPMTI